MKGLPDCINYGVVREGLNYSHTVKTVSIQFYEHKIFGKKGNLSPRERVHITMKGSGAYFTGLKQIF
jgi:hypothetical protein